MELNVLNAFGIFGLFSIGLYALMRAYAVYVTSKAKQVEAAASATTADAQIELSQNTAFLGFVTSQQQQYGEVLSEVRQLRNENLDLERRYGVTVAEIATLKGELKLVSRDLDAERDLRKATQVENELLRAENVLLKAEIHTLKHPATIVV